MFNSDHMIAGVKAAMSSPKTPPHLKAHLAKRLDTMKINPANKGKFTAKAKAAGKTVAQYANEKANAGGTLGKEANFARMAERKFRALPKKKKARADDAFLGR